MTESPASVERSSEELGRLIRRTVIEQSKRANVGHIGSALSVSDLMAVLFSGALRGKPSDRDRDRFILSKGHAALALYAALHFHGLLSYSELDRFSSDGTALGAHPEHEVEGIDFSTGSLGQGPCLAVGCALGARLEGSARRVYALISDAELNEGSVWEAAMFAAHHKLGRLTLLLDLNGQQALGYTEHVLDLADIGKRFEAFGWHVTEVDGHDHDALRESLTAPVAADSAPRLVVARTTFGRGVSFMESRIEWHYRPMSDEQFEHALTELDSSLAVTDAR